MLLIAPQGPALDLRHYRWMRSRVAFDPATGEGRFRWLAGLLSRRPTCGVADRVNGHWCALYAVDDELLFQTGTTIYCRADYPSAANRRTGKSRKFALAGQAGLGIEIEYRARDRDWDPLFDGIDLIEIDFLWYVATIWRVDDWQDLAKRWTEAQR